MIGEGVEKSFISNLLKNEGSLPLEITACSIFLNVPGSSRCNPSVVQGHSYKRFCSLQKEVKMLCFAQYLKKLIHTFSVTYSDLR